MNRRPRPRTRLPRHTAVVVDLTTPAGDPPSGPTADPHHLTTVDREICPTAGRPPDTQPPDAQPTDTQPPTIRRGAIINTNHDHDIHRPSAETGLAGHTLTLETPRRSSRQSGSARRARTSTPHVVGAATTSDTVRRRRARQGRNAEAIGLPLPQSARVTLQELRSDYTAEVSRWLARFLASHARGTELDDIIGRENTELCEKLDATMAAYPDPRAYALTRTYGQRAVLDWRRRERVQRCEGAEIAFDDRGRRTKGNYVDSFDTVAFHTESDESVTLYDLFVAEAFDLDIAVDDLVLGSIDRASFLADVRATALDLLTESERLAFELVVERGLQVVEAAAEVGVARETMGRQRDRAIAKVRDAFAARR